MIAIIRTGGKQYGVKEKDRLKIEKIDGTVGDSVTFSEVLFVGDEAAARVGMPVIDGVSVLAKILEQGRSEKVTGIKHKPKKRYKVKFGHRQPYTLVEIEKISAGTIKK